MRIALLIAVYAMEIYQHKAFVINSTNAASALQNNAYIGILAYSHITDKSKDFLDEYETQNSTLPLAVVDVKDSNTAQILGVQTVPSLILYVQSHPIYYDGVLGYSQFMDWVSTILSITFRKLIKSENETGSNSSVILVTNEEPLDYICKAYPHISFYVMRGKPAAILMNFPSLAYIRIDLNSTVIEKYIKIGSILPLTFFNNDIAEITFGMKRPTLFLVGDMRNNSTLRLDFILRIIIQSGNYSTLFYTRSNGTDRINAKLFYLLGIKEAMMPCLIYVQMQASKLDKYYYHSDNSSLREVKDFLMSIKNNTRPKYYKSDDDDDTALPILHVNSKNLINATKRTIVIVYYTPFHPDSNKMLQIISSLAAKTKHISFGAYNIFSNENEGMEFHEPVTTMLYAGTDSHRLSNVTMESELCNQINHFIPGAIKTYCYSGMPVKEEI